MANNEYCVARQRTRKREGEFRSIYFIVGGKVWNMDRGIVHPGIDVHFDIAFLNDHCRKVLHGRDFKLFGTVEN